MQLHRLILGLTATAAAAAGLLVGTASAQTTFGGCLLPTDAATAAVLNWNGFFDPSPDNQVCNQQCAQLNKWCKGAASTANQCTKKAGNAAFGTVNALCKLDGDPQTCRQNNNTIKQAQQDLLKTNNSDAKEICKQAKQDCSSLCT